MTPQEDAKDAEYWRRRWWHDRRKVYRHRWNMQRCDKHCVKCGQDAMGADDDCSCWTMRLPRRKEQK